MEFDEQLHLNEFESGDIVTKFEQVGVSFQNDATNKREANRSFQYSCRVCCERGIRIECDRCAIAAVHAANIAAFDTMQSGFPKMDRR